MTVTNYITILSVIALIVGWFVNSYLNRRHERFNKKIGYQIDMCLCYLDAAMTWTRLIQTSGDEQQKQKELTNTYLEQLETAQIKIHLFGEQHEIDAINDIVKYAQANGYRELDARATELNNRIRNRLRKEIGIRQI